MALWGVQLLKRRVPSLGQCLLPADSKLTWSAWNGLWSLRFSRRCCPLSRAHTFHVSVFGLHRSSTPLLSSLEEQNFCLIRLQILDCVAWIKGCLLQERGISGIWMLLPRFPDTSHPLNPCWTVWEGKIPQEVLQLPGRSGLRCASSLLGSAVGRPWAQGTPFPYYGHLSTY